MTTLPLDALQDEPSFALLGPGFSGGSGWTLVRDLSERDTGEAGVWLARYETPGRRATRFSGRVQRSDIVCHTIPRAPAICLDDAGFLDGVRVIREEIARGDVYQVNLTVRAALAPLGGAALLSRLCARGAPRFAAWVRLPDGTELVSASPELLVEVRGRRVHAEPMKGTARPEDRAGLEASEKDQAELAMITDLLRNDLIQLSEPRSVSVPHARRFVELPYAIQTVSDVVGTLRGDVGLRDVLAVVHPGGSVTGAPREAAMRVIAELERTPRGVYCGALGLELGEDAVFSLLIRTAERRADGGWTYGVGGGITWDSDPSAELDEVRTKLGALG